MVIFEDLRKLLLYQRLNLGFECDVCKKRFYNKLDHMNHTTSCKQVLEQLKCSKCGKTFGHEKILQLHMRFHNLDKMSSPAPPAEAVELPDTGGHEISPVCRGRESEKATGTPPLNFLQRQTISDMVEHLLKRNESKVENSLPQIKILESPKKLHNRESEKATGTPPPNFLQRQTISDVVENLLKTNETKVDNLNPIKILESPKKSPSNKIRGKSKPVKKAIGLTKVRMEDCLRCDDCSCIYIDDKDYYKHMRNFHQIDVTNNLPVTQQKSKRKCRSCCKQCRGAHCTSVKRPRATQHSSNLIFKINMQNNIQDRWTRMVSQQLMESPMPEFQSVPDIKPDLDAIAIKPDPDLSHLLSQVEVNIKTEPADDYCM